MIEPHHLNPNATPLYATVPIAEYNALQSKIDTVEKECIRIANLYETEKAKSAKLERELDNLLAKLDNTETDPDEYHEALGDLAIMNQRLRDENEELKRKLEERK